MKSRRTTRPRFTLTTATFGCVVAFAGCDSGRGTAPAEAVQARPATPSASKDCSSVAKRVRSILVEQFKGKEDEIRPAARIVDDLGADSLDVVEIVLALEEEFSVEIHDEDAEKLITVSDVEAYLCARVP